MGIIISSKRDQDKVIVETLLEHHELTQLRGELDNVHLFSEKTADFETNIAARGKNEATKYFLIPRKLRKDINLGSRDQVLCQRINTPEKVIFIYVMDRCNFRETRQIKAENSMPRVIRHEIPETKIQLRR
jgi:hypothetical protein